jgi:hypothetical protein
MHFHYENNISAMQNTSKTNDRIKQSQNILPVDQKSQDLPVFSSINKNGNNGKKTKISNHFCTIFHLIMITSITLNNVTEKHSIEKKHSLFCEKKLATNKNALFSSTLFCLNTFRVPNQPKSQSSKKFHTLSHLSLVGYKQIYRQSIAIPHWYTRTHISNIKHTMCKSAS